MKIREVLPGDGLGYSDIYRDFLADKKSARSFYLSSDLGQVAKELDKKSFDRARLVEILRDQNKKYHAGQKALDNIERLADPKAVCVFTGQQACLFGGPLLVLIKAMAITKAAQEYEKELGRPVIPIFWIAGDDHDFEEANHTFLLDRNSDVQKVAYETAPALELPTSEIFFSDVAELHRSKEQLKEILGQSDFTPELYDLLEHAYTSDDSFVSSFGKLMAALTKNIGTVFFNPGDENAKALVVPFFERLIDAQDDLRTAVTDRNNSILKSGYHIQVEKSSDASYLFYNREGRTAVHYDGEQFLVGDCRYSSQEIKDCITSHPERFSPDVMTRPVMQSFLFPVLSQKGGPSEIAYLAQINPLFEVFDVVPPVHVGRASATIIEKRFEKMMEDYQIELKDLTGDIEQVINRVLSKSFPDDLESKFSEMRDQVRKLVQQFSDQSLEFDKSLDKFSEQIIGKIDYNLKAFEGKVFSSHKKKSTESRERIYKLHRSLYPNRSLQERSLNITYFLSRYGVQFIDFLYESLESEQRSHQLIYLSEFKN